MICAVYQVGEDPDHLLLVTKDRTVVNGNYRLLEDPDGEVVSPNPNVKLRKLGYIATNGDAQDYDKLFTRFQNGERAVRVKCSLCGHVR